MDLATLIGILAGFGLVGTTIAMGPDPTGFIDVPSILIVLGGTFAATLICFPFEEFLQAFKAASKTFTSKRTMPEEVVDVMVQIAEISRREGILALERVETNNPLLKKAMQLIADNADPELIHSTVVIEISSMQKRHGINIGVFNKMAGLAPAMGMLGTLIGLIQMLSQLDDPSSLGPAMAVALITTLYGTILANFIFSPLATKLKSRSTQESMNLSIIFEGAKSILENNNPRLVYEKLSSFLAPSVRKHEDDK